MVWAGLIAAAFLLGSIPFGLLIGRACGINIREHGSKNIGATNVGRVLGRRAGLTCFTLDVGKGLAPTLTAGWLGGFLVGPGPSAAEAWAWLAVMVAAILGHVLSPWVGFRGGKGVATGLGALLGVFPYMAVPAAAGLMVWLVMLRVFRYVGLASCVAAATVPGWVALWLWVLWGWSAQPGESGRALGLNTPAAIPFLAASVALSALVIARHRSNLARTLAGTEPRVSWLGGGPNRTGSERG